MLGFLPQKSTGNTAHTAREVPGSNFETSRFHERLHQPSPRQESDVVACFLSSQQPAKQRPHNSTPIKPWPRPDCVEWSIPEPVGPTSSAFWCPETPDEYQQHLRFPPSPMLRVAGVQNNSSGQISLMVQLGFFFLSTSSVVVRTFRCPFQAAES